MRRPADFAATVRGGARRSRGRVTVHVRQTHQSEQALVGFVVPKYVGSAPERNTVKRRLRAIMRTCVDDLVGYQVVVRAAQHCNEVPFDVLQRDVCGALRAAREACRVSS